MRILVFSDTHSAYHKCEAIIDNIVGVDMIIHAGDYDRDAVKLQEKYPDIPVRYVRGNCDFSNTPREITFEAEGKKIYVTHGDLYNVKNDYYYSALKKHARSINADIAVFGHTHIPYNENCGDVIILNPGSTLYGGTFGVIEIENGKAKTAIMG